ncbi:MAG: hypothetical protein Q8R04_02445 [Nanoarchaeota archaeon]|nr:hypothetical protein [Nanoarchaeota archaeon]
MEKHLKCPNCGRNLTESELYCYFCEFDLAKLRKERLKNVKLKSKNKS